MAIALARIDDRLIHGQVVIGWGVPLGVELIVVVDDAVAGNDWEQEIYRMAVPRTVGVEFAGREAAAARLEQWAAAHRRVFILTGDPETMAALVAASAGRIRAVNLGGIHSGPGRRERLRYVYLTDREAETLRRLEAGGTVITAQDLPGATAVPLRELLR
jgi:PTS system mannose-specific IIB component/fructoselysine and glucoselysine-specific PTS system IIB component